ncbi:AEC family transporter [Alkaliphilus pronyensis]|uniref:AEC family transporter n=1 Tax=Alkaliphilus pronyensis TaxID=1482732 RepID=A0A6I0FTY7_9FIRM|nr:AEC family transporter [Alkaliphilus pronyensis]KAB3539684.1 AEC family transporter [Alkaliphilus pronyensis]
MGILTVFNEISVLFLLILSGYIARKMNLLNNEINKGISILILQFTLPALIIKSMQFSFSKELMMGSINMIIISAIVHGLAIAVAFLTPRLLKVEGERKKIFQFVLVFSNVGYMGYPVLQVIYGELGVFYGALFNIPFNFLLWTLGVFIMTHGKDGNVSSLSFKKLILNPGILSVFIGFSLFLLSIKLPYGLYKTLDLLGNTTTPLSMLVIGSMLAEITFKEIFIEEKLLRISIVRLVIIPFITFALLKAFGVSGLMLGIPVVISGMPAAANTAVFATMYDVDPHLASKAVFNTTILSMISIPLLTLLL